MNDKKVSTDVCLNISFLKWSWVCTIDQPAMLTRISSLVTGLPLPPSCTNPNPPVNFCNRHSNNVFPSVQAQLVYWLATGWTVWGSNPGGGEIFRTHPDRSWGPPILLYNGYQVFPRGKAAGAWRWPPPHLAPRSKKGWSYTSTPPLGLCGLFQGELFTFTRTF
jgi:hypothetical protein